VRRDGFAWVRDEFADEISSVAAPVRDAAGAVAAAVHVHGPSYRFPARDAEAKLGRLVLAAAQAVAMAVERSRLSISPD
jgi:DNA-binding IclR family transcriptional regulator